MGLKFTLAPVQHWSSRLAFLDRDKALWGGWVIEQPAFRFFFAGDTGYSPIFSDVGKRLGYVDLAALPIGAYEPRWFMNIVHINPEEAVKIHRELPRGILPPCTGAPSSSPTSRWTSRRRSSTTPTAPRESRPRSSS